MKTTISHIAKSCIEISKIKLRLFFFFFLVGTINIYSQSHPAQSIDLHYLAPGNVIESLGNIAGESTNSIVTEIGSSNPASIYDFKNKSAGISYQYDSKIKEAWIAGFGHGRQINFIPQSLGIVVPIDDWRFGMSMNQMYNTEIDYGTIGGTIRANNEQGFIDIGEFNPKRSELVLKTSVISSFSLENLFVRNDKVIFGLQLNYNMLKYEMNWDNLLYKNYSVYDNQFNFALGFIYIFGESAFSKSKVGIYYESKFKFQKNFYINSVLLKFSGNFPDKLHLGVYHPCGENWKYVANFSYLFWNDVNKNFKNQIELSAIAGYVFSKNFQFSFGFFSTDKKFSNNDSVINHNNLKAIYLIVSANYKIENLNFVFTIADSHLLSDDWRKQTIFKIGTGYEF